jgi:hypothetical protein
MKYFNSDIEVKLGDRVSYRRFLLWKTSGKVVYLPGESPTNDRLEFNGTKQWVLRLDDGRHLAFLFPTVLPFANQRVGFIERGSLDDVLDRTDIVS